VIAWARASDEAAAKHATASGKTTLNV